MDVDEQQLRIKLSDGEEPILTQLLPVLPFSSCVCGLVTSLGASAGVVDWDLSDLRVNGASVSRETVLAWLNVVHTRVHGAQQDSSSATTAHDLCILLEFADAVGSTKGLLEACCLSGLDKLQIHVDPVPQPQRGWTVKLAVDGTAYVFLPETPLHLSSMSIDPIYDASYGNSRDVAMLRSQEAKNNFISQAAAQTEQLLYLAYHLQLQPLVDKLHLFINSSTAFDGSMFLPTTAPGVLDGVLLSPRVVKAAGLGPSQQCKKAWINSIVTQPLWLGSGLLLPTEGTCNRAQAVQYYDEEAESTLTFRAVLQRDFLGMSKGREVGVSVQLNLGVEGLVQVMINGLAVNSALHIGRRLA